MKPIDCFRKAIKEIVRTMPKQKRLGFKEKIASSAGLKREELDHLVMGRRVGTETVRRTIASFLGYESYEDFLLLGEELLKGLNYEDAKSSVNRKRTLRPNPDGSIEIILAFWSNLTEEQKVELRRVQRLMVFKNSRKGEKLEKYKKQSRERFQYLWDSVQEKKTLQIPLGWAGADLLISYLEGKTTDVEVLEYADQLNANLLKNMWQKE